MIDIRKLALNLGFDNVKIIKPIKFNKWKEHVDSLRLAGHIVPTRLHYDPFEAFKNVKSIVVLMNHYNPYVGWGRDNVQIHSYYFTGNKTYKLGKELGDKLTELGIGNTTKSLLPTRHAAFAAGYGISGIMGPLINDEFGSYMCFQIIMVDIEQEYDEIVAGDMQRCMKCYSCVAACDNAAIQPEGRVYIEKCYRHYAPGINILPLDMRNSIGMRFLGCGDCQDACPLNSKIKPTQVPEEILKATYLPNLLDYKNKEWKNHINNLAELIGKNEARPTRTLAQCALHAGNTEDKKYIPLLRECTKHNDERVRIYSIWSLKKLGDDKFIAENGWENIEK